MKAAVLLAICALAAPARADDVTLAQVVAAAGGAPAAAVPAYELASAEARIDAARAWPAPTVHVETNRITARLVAGLALPLPIFGTVGAARREASAHAEVVRAEGRTIVRDLHHRAVAAWLELARADASAEALILAAQQAAELERITQGRLDAGAGAEVDVTAAHAARMRADLAVVAAHRDQEAAGAQLAAILGWDPTRPLTSAGPLPGGTADLAGLRGALAAHPDRQLALQRIREGEATEDTARVLRRPSIAFELQGSFSDPTQPGTDVLVGLVMDLPVFSRVGDQIRAAQAQTQAERARLTSEDARLAGELVAAYHRWQSASEKLAGLQTDVLPAQDKAARLAQQAYREGARDLASALQAQRDLAGVRSEIANAGIDVAAAWVDLQVAAGGEPGAR